MVDLTIYYLETHPIVGDLMGLRDYDPDLDVFIFNYINYNHHPRYSHYSNKFVLIHLLLTHTIINIDLELELI